eukprot:scaffold55953_cov21-Tisochrysis_lutea.AAC.1
MHMHAFAHETVAVMLVCCLAAQHDLPAPNISRTQMFERAVAMAKLPSDMAYVPVEVGWEEIMQAFCRLVGPGVF